MFAGPKLAFPAGASASALTTHAVGKRANERKAHTSRLDPRTAARSDVPFDLAQKYTTLCVLITPPSANTRLDQSIASVSSPRPVGPRLRASTVELATPTSPTR